MRKIILIATLCFTLITNTNLRSWADPNLATYYAYSTKATLFFSNGHQIPLQHFFYRLTPGLQWIIYQDKNSLYAQRTTNLSDVYKLPLSFPEGTYWPINRLFLTPHEIYALQNDQSDLVTINLATKKISTIAYIATLSPPIDPGTEKPEHYEYRIETIRGKSVLIGQALLYYNSIPYHWFWCNDQKCVPTKIPLTNDYSDDLVMAPSEDLFAYSEHESPGWKSTVNIVDTHGTLLASIPEPELTVIKYLHWVNENTISWVMERGTSYEADSPKIITTVQYSLRTHKATTVPGNLSYYTNNSPRKSLLLHTRCSFSTSVQPRNWSTYKNN